MKTPKVGIKEVVEGRQIMNGKLRIAGRLTTNWLRLKASKKRLPRPIVLSYFVTFRCNLTCSFCDYTDPGYRTKYPELSTSEAIRVLEVSREGSPAVAFSGGEPLVREDIVDIVRAARRLRYGPIMLFTNTLLLPEKEEVLDYVDHLQFSLDTVEESGRQRDHRGVSRTVKDNVRRYAKLQKRKGFSINVNCVVTEDRIDDARGVLEFAEENGIGFTIAPRLRNEAPDPALVGNRSYEALIGDVIAAKRRGRIAMDTFAYLSHIRHFRPFQCQPWLTPRVYPNGELLYPCSSLAFSTFHILAAGSWKRIEETILREHGARVECGRRCFLPCYLEASTLLSDIRGAIKDLWRL